MLLLYLSLVGDDPGGSEECTGHASEEDQGDNAKQKPNPPWVPPL